MRHPGTRDACATLGGVIDRRAVAVLAVAVMLTACAGASDRNTPGTEPTPSTSAATPSIPTADGLTATVVQYTRDRPARVVQVKVENTSNAAVDVELLEPRLRGYDAAEPPAQVSHLEADRRVDFPVTLGEPSCDAPARGGSDVVIRAKTADGTSVRRSLPIDDADGLLARAHERDCAVAGVEAAVDITVDDAWRRVGEGADAAVLGHVTMALRPGGVSARVVDLDAGVLLNVTSGRPRRGGADPTYVVDSDHPRTEWDLEVVGARCDGHALAESQRLMALTFYVSVRGAEPVPLRRAPDVDGYETMVAALLDRCEHLE